MSAAVKLKAATASLEAALTSGCTAMGVSLSAMQSQSLLHYLELLIDWNRAHNLTAVHDSHDMISHHLLDSLSLVPLIGTATTLVDVGSGGGLPGVPLAVACPHLSVTLIDSRSKKTAFLTHVRHTLHLTNITVVHERVENWQPTELFDIVTCRAFSEVDEFFHLTRHLSSPHGRFIAMQGRRQKSWQAPWEILPLSVSGLAEERHAVMRNL